MRIGFIHNKSGSEHTKVPGFQRIPQTPRKRDDILTGPSDLVVQSSDSDNGGTEVRKSFAFVREWDRVSSEGGQKSQKPGCLRLRLLSLGKPPDRRALRSYGAVIKLYQ
jgi:hypothetical protein